MNTLHPASRPRRALLAAALTAVVFAITACGGGDDDNGTTATTHNVLYVESNHLTPGQHSVLGYARAADGSLTPRSADGSGGVLSRAGSNPLARRKST